MQTSRDTAEGARTCWEGENPFRCFSDVHNVDIRGEREGNEGMGPPPLMVAWCRPAGVDCSRVQSAVCMSTLFCVSILERCAFVVTCAWPW